MADDTFDKLDKATSSDSRDELLTEHILTASARQTLKEREQDMEHRKKFACASGWVAVIYLAAVMVIVFLCGFGLMCLSDFILAVLLGTTMTNVLGVFAFVMKYLFTPKK